MTPDNPQGPPGPKDPKDPTAAEAPGLDAGAVARLRQLDPGNRRGMLQRVFSTFEASLLRVLSQLQAARSGADAPAVMALAHTLKSSSASVGALALSSACADVERRLRTGQPGALHTDIDRLSQECHAALTAVRAMLQP